MYLALYFIDRNKYYYRFTIYFMKLQITPKNTCNISTFCDLKVTFQKKLFSSLHEKAMASSSVSIFQSFVLFMAFRLRKVNLKYYRKFGIISRLKCNHRSCPGVTTET